MAARHWAHWLVKAESTRQIKSLAKSRTSMALVIWLSCWAQSSINLIIEPCAHFDFAEVEAEDLSDFADGFLGVLPGGEAAAELFDRGGDLIALQQRGGFVFQAVDRSL